MKCSCHSHNGFLTELGLELAQRISPEGLTPGGDSVIVDMVGSVSALDRDRDLHVIDELIDEQYRRAIYGS